jgi:hypothetical protein
MVNSHKHQRKYKNITKKIKEKKNGKKGKVTKYTIKHKKSNKVKKTKKTIKRIKTKKHHQKHSHTNRKMFDDNNLEEINKHIDEYLDEIEKATHDYYKNYKKEINQLKNKMKEMGHNFDPNLDLDSKINNSQKNLHRGGFIGVFGSVLAAPFKGVYYAGKGIKDGAKWMGKGIRNVASRAKDKVVHGVGKFSQRTSKGVINTFRAIPGFRSGRIIRNSKGEKVFMSKGKTMFGFEPKSTEGMKTRLNYINERISGKRQKLDKLIGKVEQRTNKFESQIANLNQKILNTKDPKLIAKYETKIGKFEKEMITAQHKYRDKITAAEKKLREKVEKYAKVSEKLKQNLSEKVRKSEKRIREGFSSVCSKFTTSGIAGAQSACNKAMRNCKGHTSNEPISATLACMGADPGFSKLNLSLSQSDLVNEMKKNANKSLWTKNRHLKEIKKVETGKVSAAQNAIKQTNKRILETDAYAMQGPKFDKIYGEQKGLADQFKARAINGNTSDRAIFETLSRDNPDAFRKLKFSNLSTSKLQEERSLLAKQTALQEQQRAELFKGADKYAYDIKATQTEISNQKQLLQQMDDIPDYPEALKTLRKQEIEQLEGKLLKLQNPELAAKQAEAQALAHTPQQPTFVYNIQAPAPVAGHAAPAPAPVAGHAAPAPAPHSLETVAEARTLPPPPPPRQVAAAAPAQNSVQIVREGNVDVVNV